MKTGFAFLVCMIYSLTLSAQQDTSGVRPKLSFSGYADVYYAYDFSHPASHERPFFLYNHNRHNEVNLNLGFVKATYTSQKIRANLALMAGTYAQYNLAAEQGLLKNVYEANAGIKLSSEQNLWLDAGVFTSHIGFESAVSKECWTLTRSIVAENSPYYLSGAKLTYISKNNQLLFSGLYLNGWQRIQRVQGNNSPAFGTHIMFKPNDKLTLNYSTFIGNDKPDSVKQMRYYHNVYTIWQPTAKWGLIFGFDYGMEQNSKRSSKYNKWYSPTVIVRYLFTEKLAAAVRYEYYADPNGVIIPTLTPNGFHTSGYSLNADFNPQENFVWRIEVRMFDSQDNIFAEGSRRVNRNYFIVSSFAITI